jgi:anti-sigma regulatory factor (Ser/Thr protein kinase)
LVNRYRGSTICVVKESVEAGAVAVKVVEYHQPTDLAGVRRLVVQQATAAGITADRATALSVAINELAVHSLRRRHGGVVSIWATTDEVRVTVAVEGILRPVARMRPVDDPAAEHGLLLVGALCDHVHIREHPDGVTIHLTMARG